MTVLLKFVTDYLVLILGSKAGELIEVNVEDKGLYNLI